MEVLRAKAAYNEGKKSEGEETMTEEEMMIAAIQNILKSLNREQLRSVLRFVLKKL